MKVCNVCGLEKALEDFHRDKARKDGHRLTCKECARVRTSVWHAEQQERDAAYRHEYARRPDVMLRKREELRERHLADKEAAFAHYGEACARCGSGDDLQIDHIDDSGEDHRRTDKEARTMYRWLRKHGYPDGFQTLCRSCNLAKARARKAS